MPLADRYSVYVTEKTGSTFGSKRLWGTVGFLLTSLGGGLIFNMWGVRPLPIVMLVLFAIMGVVALNMPKSIRTIGERSSLFDKTNPLIQVVSNSRLIGMITACALIQCSNAYLYSFSSVVWTEQYGFTAGVIALIWSVGLVAEIAMFTFADRLIDRFGIKTILLSASVVTMVRWGLLGSYTFLPTIVMAQLLQAFTLSLNISVLMRYIIENTSQNIKASAISLYMTLGIGLFLSLMILLTTGLGLGVDKSGFYVMIIPVFLAAVITILLNPSKRQSS
jgi:PPP family 3-phenylpropionic acid transporter